LATGTAIGHPLTGHTGPLAAVAALVLPDGRPVAAPAASGWAAGGPWRCGGTSGVIVGGVHPRRLGARLGVRRLRVGDLVDVYDAAVAARE
jgi:hypothetical protein